MKLIERLIYTLVILALAFGVIAAARRPPIRQDPTCDDAPKVGIALLNPGGTENAMEQIVFDIPFCTDTLAAFATVDNGNTAGEAVGAKPWGVEAVNVSMQLDEASTAVYTVYWRVELINQ